MDEIITVINGGSSSLKFSVFDIAEKARLERRLAGQIEGLGARPHFVARDRAGAMLDDRPLTHGETADRQSLLGFVIDWVKAHAADAKTIGFGHRVVHGGPEFSAPAIVDANMLEALERLRPLAPLHLPDNIAYIEAAIDKAPGLPQVACFDTAFHRDHPRLADLFALPRQLYEDGVRRYGFHGLSYEYIARQLPVVAPDIADGRVIVAHLGSGASMCALNGGRSVDSTMSFTPLDGLPMGTRPGALDPGVVLHLIRERNMDADAVERLLYKESGLLGLSGVSNDVRELSASAAPHAREALDYLVYRVAQLLGSLAASLGGVDGIVFTAGIGENAPEIRARICHAAAWMGVVLDERENARGGPLITQERSTVSAWVIPTDEERMIGLHALALLQDRGSGAG